MSNDFNNNMMDAPGFLPYDSRNAGPPQMQQRPMPMQYVVGTPYTQAPMQTMPAPHYQAPNGFSYVPYHSPSPSTPVGSPFRPEYQERAVPQNEHGRPMVFQRRDSKTLRELHARSPARSESLASNATNPTANAKTITYNETIDPKDRVNFETDVDELMKAIQTKAEEKEAAAAAAQGPTPAHTPGPEGTEPSSPCSTQHGATPAPGDSKPKKKWVCNGPNCNKSFVQKTHLDIHRRTHTGAKPYVCTKDNCGLTFSQRGNLKTHMRRHTGEKPFCCRICGKTFAQRGNVRSHEETHKGLKPYVCKLDDCNKTFSQLGNMKTHQNNFHKETLKDLTAMFVKFVTEDHVPEEHQELFDYFKEHYKNSNKGVKGRGKARTVAARKPKGQGRTQSIDHSVQAIPQQPLPVHHAGVPAYDLSAQGGPVGMASIPRTHNSEYAMFEAQQDASNGMLYDDDHSRHMTFTDRMY